MRENSKLWDEEPMPVLGVPDVGILEPVDVGVERPVVVDEEVNFAMPFEAGNGVYDDAFHI